MCSHPEVKNRSRIDHFSPPCQKPPWSLAFPTVQQGPPDKSAGSAGLLWTFSVPQPEHTGRLRPQGAWCSFTTALLSTGTFFPPDIYMLVPFLPSGLCSNVISLSSPFKIPTFHPHARFPIILSYLACYISLYHLFQKFVSFPHSSTKMFVLLTAGALAPRTVPGT